MATVAACGTAGLQNRGSRWDEKFGVKIQGSLRVHSDEFTPHAVSHIIIPIL